MIEHDANREDLLRDAAEALAVTAGYTETIDRVAQLAVPRLAAACLIDIDENGALTRRAAVNSIRADATFGRMEAPHPDVGEGAPAVLRSGRPLVYGSGWFAALGRVDPALRALSGGPLQTIAILPLTFDHRPIGAITLGRTALEGTSDMTLLSDFARIAAVAISNARLLEEARRARDFAESARARLSFVSRAGAMLARSFDRDTTLQRLLAATVPDFADGAQVSIVDAGVHELRAGAVTAEMEALALTAMQDARTRLDAETQTLAVPLLSGGRVCGALSFRRTNGRTLFAIDDLTMIEEVASRVAMFVETARTYAHQHNLSQTLQRAFRPRDLPQRPGLTIAAGYQPGTDDVDVGGDWYDIVELDDDRIAFAIGDVMGHGVEAAAMMAELRSGLRAHLYAETPPGQCLGFVDKLLTYSSGERDMFATGMTAVYDRRSHAFTIANAGHPSPYLRRANGDIVPIVAHAPLLGLDAGARSEQTQQLAPGDVLLFYTDGVVEDRALSYEQGLRALETVLSETAEPAEMIDRILALNIAGSDDRTLLAFRVE